VQSRKLLQDPLSTQADCVVVKACVKSNKNDAKDAEAICAAMSLRACPSYLLAHHYLHEMRFVGDSKGGQRARTHLPLSSDIR
jgi:hypothetical protein